MNTRRSSESRAASTNWISDETTTSDAIKGGPPASSAATQTAMNAPDVPIARTCPDPIRPSRTTCRMVATPLTTSAATTPQEMYESGCPAIRATMTTPSATGAMIVIAACSPTPTVTSAGGLILRLVPDGPVVSLSGHGHLARQVMGGSGLYPEPGVTSISLLRNQIPSGRLAGR